MSHEIEKAIVVERPLEEVWQYIADPRNDPKWCEKVISVEQLAGDVPGPGASYRVVHRPVRLKKPKQLAGTVEEFDPPHRMRVREEDEDAVFNAAYDLESIGEATRVTQRDQIDWKIPRFQ